jgi:hypothetical protein
MSIDGDRDVVIVARLSLFESLASRMRTWSLESYVTDVGEMLASLAGVRTLSSAVPVFASACVAISTTPICVSVAETTPKETFADARVV